MCIRDSIRIISTSYTTEEEEPVVEIYGKARDGRSVTVLVRGFRPYLYGVDVPKAMEDRLKEESETVSLDHVPLLYRGRTVDALRITIKVPGRSRTSGTSSAMPGSSPSHPTSRTTTASPTTPTWGRAYA